MKFQIGDKVKLPKQKSTGANLEDSAVVKEAIENNQDFLYITGYEEKDDYCEDDHYLVSNDKEDLSNGDYFMEEDLELYERK